MILFSNISGLIFSMFFRCFKGVRQVREAKRNKIPEFSSAKRVASDIFCYNLFSVFYKLGPDGKSGGAIVSSTAGGAGGSNGAGGSTASDSNSGERFIGLFFG